MSANKKTTYMTVDQIRKQERENRFKNLKFDDDKIYSVDEIRQAAINQGLIEAPKPTVEPPTVNESGRQSAERRNPLDLRNMVQHTNNDTIPRIAQEAVRNYNTSRVGSDYLSKYDDSTSYTDVQNDIESLQNIRGGAKRRGRDTASYDRAIEMLKSYASQNYSLDDTSLSLEDRNAIYKQNKQDIADLSGEGNDEYTRDYSLMRWLGMYDKNAVSSDEANQTAIDLINKDNVKYDVSLDVGGLSDEEKKQKAEELRTYFQDKYGYGFNTDYLTAASDFYNSKKSRYENAKVDNEAYERLGQASAVTSDINKKDDYEQNSVVGDYGMPTSREEVNEYITNANNARIAAIDDPTQKLLEQSANRSNDLPDKLGSFFAVEKEEIAETPNTYVQLRKDYAGSGFAVDTYDRTPYTMLQTEGYKNHWDVMTNEEVGAYYYLLNTEGKDAAYEYLDSLTNTLQKRANYENKKTEMEISGEEGTITNLDWLVRNASTVPDKVAGGIAGYIDNVSHYIAGEDIEPYSNIHGASLSATATREAAGETLDKKAGAEDANRWAVKPSQLYQGVMSAADMATAMIVGPEVYGASMGMSAAEDTARDLWEQGEDNDTINALSTAAGTAEMLFEELSLDKIIKISNLAGESTAKGLVKNYLLNMVKSSGIEASEEVLTEAANMVVDYAVRGDRSDEAGYSFADVANRLYQAGVGGAIGGLLGGGGATTLSATAKGAELIQNQSERNKYIAAVGPKVVEAGNTQELIDQAKAVEGDSKAVKNIQAQADRVSSLSAKQGTGNRFSNWVNDKRTTKAAGKLYTSMQENNISRVASAEETEIKTALSKAYAEKIKADVNDKSVSKVVDALYKSEYTDEPLTISERRIVNNNQKAKAALSDVQSNEDVIRSQINRAQRRATEDMASTAALTGTKEQATEKPAKIDIDDFNLSDDGKTYTADGGEQVDIKSISSVNADDIRVELSNGKTESVKALDLGSEDQAVVYQGIMDIQTRLGAPVTASFANAVVNEYNQAKASDANLSTTDFIYGVEEAVRKGYMNDNGGNYAVNLSESAREALFDEGRKIAQEHTKAQQKSVQSRIKGDNSQRKGTVTYEDGIERSQLNERQQVGVDVVTHIAEETGIDVVFFRSTKDGKGRFSSNFITKNKLSENGQAPNGFWLGGKMYIDVNAGMNGEGLILFTAAHEIVHMIREGSPESFKALADFLVENYAKKGVDVNKLVLKEMTRSTNLNYDQAFEEVIAQSCESFLRDIHLSDKTEQLYKTDKGLATKIKNILNRILNALKKWYGVAKPQSVEANYVLEMKDALSEAYDKYIAGIRAASENLRNMEKPADEGGAKLQARGGSSAFNENAVSTAIWEALDHADQGYDNLIKVSSMPQYIVDHFGITGDFYIQRNHTYENIKSEEEAVDEGRFNKQAHYHHLGVDTMTDAILSIENPIMTITDTMKGKNPTVTMLLNVMGENGAPLYAALSFYSDKHINGKFDKKPHVVLTVSERNWHEDGDGRKGYDEIISKAVKEGRVVDFDFKRKDDLSVIAEDASLGNITESSLEYNLAQFKKEINTYKENNNIHYQSRSDADYLSAVKRGDMETAQRMVDEAAERAFAKSKIRDEDGKLMKVYHGTDADFTVFDRAMGRANMDIQGMFFSPWDIDAGGYGSNVRAFYLNITNPADESTGYKALNSHKGENYAGIKAREDLERMGYDGVNNSDEEYIAFNSEQIKLADPVTYDDNGDVIPLSERFNESNKDIRYQARDEDYIQAVDDGNMDTAQKMVDQAAEAAGYTPKMMYHGSPNFFTSFDKKRARYSGYYGKGFYFSDTENQAKVYGNTYKVYLKTENPLQFGKNDITREQVKSFLSAVSENEDYDLYNYGTEDINKIVDMVYRNDALQVIQDINATAIGELGEAIALFNEVNGTNYDSVIVDTETVVYSPEQIKSAEPVTYDDDGKVIPLSQRFDSTKTDIRYQSRDNDLYFGVTDDAFDIDFGEDDSVENLIAREFVTHHEDMGEVRQNVADIELTPKKVESIVNRVIRDNLGRLDEESRHTLSIELQMALERVNVDDPQTVSDNIIGAVRKAIEGSTVVDDKAVSDYNQLRDAFKGKKFYLTDEQVNQLKEHDMTLDSYRRAMMGKVTIVKRENAKRSISGGYADAHELSLESLHDTLESPDEVLGFRSWEWDEKGYDAPNIIKKAFETLRDRREQPITKVYSEEAIDERAVAIAAKITGGIVEAKYNSKQNPYVTKLVADLKQKRTEAVNKQKEKNRQKLAELKQKERERAEKREQDIRQKYREQRARGYENRKRTELRGKIKQLIGGFNTMLTHPVEGKYIPRGFVSQTIDILNAINTDSRRSERLSAAIADLKVKYEGLKADETGYASYNSAMDERLRVLSEMIEAEAEEWVPKRNKSIAYENKRAATEGKPLKRSVTSADFSIQNMSLELLQYTYETLNGMRTVIRESMRMTGEETRKMRQQITDALIGEVKGVRREHTNMLTAYGNLSKSGYIMFKSFADYKKNSEWENRQNELNKGQLETSRFEIEFSKPTLELIADKKSLDKMLHTKVDVGLKDADGNPVLVTHDMLVHIYLDLSNEHNADHVAGDGYHVPDLDLYYKGKRSKSFEVANSRLASGPYIRAVELSQRMKELDIRLNTALTNEEDTLSIENEIDKTAAEIKKLKAESDKYLNGLKQAVESKMTAYDYQWVEAWREFNDMATPAINNVTMQTLGFKKAVVDNYFPVTVDKSFRAPDFDTIVSDMSLESWGSLKERVKGAKGAIVLQGITDVMADRIHKTALYCGMTIPIQNFRKVYGGTQYNFTEKKEGDDFKTSVQRELDKKFGTPTVGDSANVYIKKLIADLIESRNNSDNGADKLLALARGGIAVSTLTTNPRVWLVQAASLVSALPELDIKSVLKGTATIAFKWNPHYKQKGAATRLRMSKVTPLYDLRRMGMVDTELGDIAKQRSSKASKAMAFTQKIANLTQKVDSLTTGRIWFMCEYWVKDHKPNLREGTIEFDKAVAEKYNQVIERTQPNYTPMQRGQILRSKNAVTKLFTMWQTQRMQNVNMLFDAVGTLNRTIYDYNHGLNGVNRNDLKTAWYQAGKTTLAFIVSNAMIVAIQAATDILIYRKFKRYADDDDELTTESVLYGIFLNYLSTLAGNFFGGSELEDMISAVITGERYNEINPGLLGTVIEDVASVVKTAQALKSDGVLSSDFLTNLNTAITNWCGVFGIAARNTEKLYDGVVGWIEKLVDKDLFQFSEIGSRVNKALNARAVSKIVKGDYSSVSVMTQDKYDEAYTKLWKKGKSEEDCQSAGRTAAKKAIASLVKETYLSTDDFETKRMIRLYMYKSGYYVVSSGKKKGQVSLDVVDKTLESWKNNQDEKDQEAETAMQRKYGE